MILIVFLKFPEPGRVKTRLASRVGHEEAVRIYHELVRRTLAQVAVERVSALRLCFDPPDCEDAVRAWLEPALSPARERGLSVSFHPQTQGDLGDRLIDAFSKAFGEGLPVAAIGTDCVELDEALLDQARAALETSDAVFGPTPDGGYYLVALREPHPELFRGIPWSCQETLERTLVAADASGLSVSLLPERDDVDTEEDWRRLCSRCDLV